jgi:hypothetical protein
MEGKSFMQLHENIVPVLIVMIRVESKKLILRSTYNFYPSLLGIHMG